MWGQWVALCGEIVDYVYKFYKYFDNLNVFTKYVGRLDHVGRGI